MALPADPLKWAIASFNDGKNLTYNSYQTYIDGYQPLALATERYASTFGRLFENFSYNRCEAVVDAHADRLQVAGFGADDEVISQRAMDLWDANHMDVREGHIESDAFGLGDSYVIVEKHPERNQTYMWVQNPNTVRVHYADDVPGMVDLASKTWKNDDGYQRLNMYYAGRIEKYISRQRAITAMPNAGSFERYDSADGPWEFALAVPGIVPVFPFHNNGRTNGYGRSELRNVLPLQDALNKAMTDLFVASEFAAWPQRVLIGVEPAAEGDQTLNRYTAGIDRILTLFAPDAKIGEFSAANIAQYIAIIEYVDQSIARTARIPAHYLNGISGNISGRALRAAEVYWVKKLQDRQKAFSVPIAEAVSYGLALDGLNVEPGKLRVNWDSVTAMTEDDQMDLAVMKKRELEMSLETVLRELGYEPDQITQILEEKRRATDEAMREFNRGGLGVAGPIADEDDLEEAA
jgi:hypothetical protein